MRSSPALPLSPRDRLLKLARTAGLVRPKDLAAIGVPREYLRRLCQEGVLQKASRGLYVLTAAQPSEHQSLVEACQRVPRAVVCLLSALQFHGLTTQIPAEVWLAIGQKAWQPRVEYPPLRITRYSAAALTYGVLTRQIGGRSVRVFNPAKTIADCFKFRHKIGLDVALEALRDGLRQKQANLDAIWQAAAVCRVTNVIRPYLEALA